MYRPKLTFLALLTTACTMCTPKVEPVDESEREVEFVAGVEQYKGSEGKLVSWQRKDAVNVYSACGDNVRMTTSQRNTTALFYGDIKGQPVYAFHPYSENNRLRDGRLSIALGETQTYDPALISASDNASLAVISDLENVTFRNVCGLFELNLKMESGNVSVGKIVLSDNTNPICGGFTVDTTRPEPVARYSNNGESEITLDCGQGVVLGTTPTPFRFVLPQGSLNEGFQLAIYTTDGRLIRNLSVSEDCSIQRGAVSSYDAPAIKWIPDGYTELPAISAKGNNFINTGLNPRTGDKYSVTYTPAGVGEGVVMGCEIPGGSALYVANPSSNRLICSVVSTPSRQSLKTLQYQGGDRIEQNLELASSKARLQICKTSGASTQTSSVVESSAAAVCPAQSLYLLASGHVDGIEKGFIGDFHYATITNGGAMRAYYIPVQRVSDSKKGVYDVVGGTFLPLEKERGGVVAPPIDINIENDLTQEYWNYVLAHPYVEGDYSVSYMKNYYKQNVGYKKDWPRPASISWERDEDSTSQRLIVAEDEDFSKVWFTQSLGNTATSFDIYNFLPNRTYWYKVVATVGGEDEDLVTGQINTTGRRRVIRIDSQVFNVRDFGGLPIGTGKHVRFEQIYRGGRWNGNGTAITTEGKENLKQVGILSELDLRSESESEYLTSSRGGSQIEYKRFSNSGSTNIFGQYYYEKCNNGDIFIQALQYMIDKVREGKPVYMHCSIGADRTGTLALLTEGLLGVDAMNICMDWELTSLALVTAAPGDDLRSRYRPECSQNFNYQGMWEAVVNNHPGTTTQEKFYHYFNKGYKGDGTGATISSADLDWFINYMTVENN